MLLVIDKHDIQSGKLLVETDGLFTVRREVEEQGAFFCAEPEQKTVTVPEEPEQKTVTPNDSNEKSDDKSPENTVNNSTEQKTVTKDCRLQLNIDGFAIYTENGMVVGATSFSAVEFPFVKSMSDAGNEGVPLNAIRDKKGDLVDDDYARRLKNTIENKLLDANIPFFVRSEILEKSEYGRVLQEKYFYLEPLNS